MTIKLKVVPKKNKLSAPNCGQTGHQQSNCNVENPKCTNCNGPHKTLAAICPVRKELIKTRGKEVRERSRSRSVVRVTYANTATNNTIPNARSQQQQQTFTPPPPFPSSNLDMQNTTDLVAKIITSIVFAHYTESQMPGTFQSTDVAMFKENGLPKVNFPCK